MDYATCQTAHVLSGLVLFFLLYDIWCHYSVHLDKRINDSRHLSLPPGMTISGGIDQFHVHGHQASCYPRYSPVFAPGVGILVVDVIESLWPDVNGVSGSTRGMTTGHRQEVIDDVMNDSNWNKLTRQGKSGRPLLMVLASFI